MNRSTYKLRKICLGVILCLAGLTGMGMAKDLFPDRADMFMRQSFWFISGMIGSYGGVLIFKWRIAPKREWPALVTMWHDKRAEAIAQAATLDAGEREALRNNMSRELRNIEKTLPIKLVKQIYADAKTGKRA